MLSVIRFIILTISVILTSSNAWCCHGVEPVARKMKVKIEEDSPLFTLPQEVVVTFFEYWLGDQDAYNFGYCHEDIYKVYFPYLKDKKMRDEFLLSTIHPDYRDPKHPQHITLDYARAYFGFDCCEGRKSFESTYGGCVAEVHKSGRLNDIFDIEFVTERDQLAASKQSPRHWLSRDMSSCPDLRALPLEILDLPLPNREAIPKILWQEWKAGVNPEFLREEYICGKYMTNGACRIQALPFHFYKFANLRQLKLNFHGQILPPQIGKLSQLRSLTCKTIKSDLREGLIHIHPGVFNATTLNQLVITGSFKDLPTNIIQLVALHKLRLGGKLETLPEGFGSLVRLRVLSLKNNHLTRIPKELYQLTALQKLNLSSNRLESLDDDIGRLTQLTKFVCSNNRLTSIPETLCLCTRLTVLAVTNNSLTALPEGIGNLTQLTKISFDNNNLMELPLGITQLRRPELEVNYRHNPGLDNLIHLMDEELPPVAQWLNHADDNSRARQQRERDRQAANNYFYFG